MNRTVFSALAAALLLPGALLAQSRWVPADLQAAPPFMAGAPTRSVAPTLTAPSLALPTQSTAALFRSRTDSRPDLTLDMDRPVVRSSRFVVDPLSSAVQGGLQQAQSHFLQAARPDARPARRRGKARGVRVGGMQATPAGFAFPFAD